MNLNVFGYISSILLFLYTIYFTYSYAKVSTPWLVFFITILSYFISFIPIILIIMDIIDDTERLEVYFAIIYWSGFILTYGLLPILIKYYESGHFTIKNKLLYSIKANIKFYSIIIILLIGFIIFISVNTSSSSKFIIN